MIDTVTSSPPTATSESRATLSQNFDTFLTLLTAQLANQDPLDPVDSAQFTEQLVQYSQVEQQISTNDQLAELLSSIAISNASSGVAFIGRTAQIDSDVASLSDGAAQWTFDVTGAEGDVQLSVIDERGRVVRSQTVGAAAGAQTFEWDGRSTSGATLPDGPYRLAVKAVDADGEAVEPSIHVHAKITGLAPSSDGMRYLTDSGEIDFNAIVSIHD
jgi:flagellar basal-body rod modification protein FlgD